MKTSIIYLIAALAVMGTGVLHAQYCPSDVNTDPRNSSNPNRPELANQFFWFPHNGQNNSSFEFVTPLATYENINSPFWAGTEDFAVGQLAFNQASDFWPEDGWELLTRNFGRLNNGQQRVTLPNMPYITLYNKFTGTIRFLGMWPNSQDTWDIIKFTVSLPQRKLQVPDGSEFGSLQATNLLSIQGDAAQPLDHETEENVYEIITEFPGTSRGSYFFWFDLPVAYDPCICDNDVAILIRSEQVQSWDLTIQGSLSGQIIQETTPNTTNNSSALVFQRIIGAAGATATAIATNGAVIQTSQFTGLLEIFSQNQTASAQARRNASLIKDVLDTSADIVYDPTKMEWRNTVTDSSMNNKDWDKLFSGIGSFMNLGVNYFNPTSKGNQPRSTLVGRLTATGTAINTGQSGDRQYWGVPGSNWTEDLLEEEEVKAENGLNIRYPEYPMYNNPLGVFTLTETPTIQVKRDEVSVCSALITWWDDDWDVVDTLYENETRTRFTVFFDQEQFKYAFNPTLDLNNDQTNIKASIVVKNDVSGENRFQTHIHADDEGNFCNGSQSGIFNTYDGFTEVQLFNGVNFERDFERSMVSIPVPFDDFNEVAGKFLANQFNAPIEHFRFFVRFLIEIESNKIGRDGQPVTNTYVITFPLNAVEYDASEPLPIPVIDIKDNLGKSVYDIDEQFTGSSCIFHDGYVEISAHLSSPSGTTKLVSPSVIHLKPGAQLSPDMHLKTGYPFESSVPQQPLADNEIGAFCGSTNYQAKEFSALAQEVNTTLPEDLFKINSPNHVGEILVFYPNPARSEFTIQSQGAGIDRLTIFDMATRPAMQASPGGQSLYRMDISKLAPGVYIVRAECSGEVLTEKLVVAR